MREKIKCIFISFVLIILHQDLTYGSRKNIPVFYDDSPSDSPSFQRSPNTERLSLLPKAGSNSVVNLSSSNSLEQGQELQISMPEKKPGAIGIDIERSVDKGDWSLYRSGLARPNPNYVADLEGFEHRDAWEWSHFIEYGKTYIEAELRKQTNSSVQDEVLDVEEPYQRQAAKGQDKRSSDQEIEKQIKKQLLIQLQQFDSQVLTAIETSGLFFNYALKKSNKWLVLGSAGAGLALTALGTQADAILAVVSGGEALHLPISGWSSRLILGCTIGLSLVPETHEWAKNFLSLSRWNTKEPFRKMRFEETPGQTAAKVAVAFGPLVRAAVKGFFLFALESDHVKDGNILFYFIVAPSFLSETLWKYRVGRTAVNRAFYSSATDADCYQKKKIIKVGLKNFLKRINGHSQKDIAFRRKIYDKLKDKITTKFNYADMLQNLNHLKNEAISITGLFLVYGAVRDKRDLWGLDVGTIPNRSSKDKFFKWLGALKTAFAGFGYYKGISYAIDNYAFNVLFPPSNALSYVSRGIGAAFAAGEMLLDFGSSKMPKYSSFLPTKENYPNHPVKRYAASLLSGGNSLLHLWWAVYMAEQALLQNNSPMLPMQNLSGNSSVPMQNTTYEVCAFNQMGTECIPLQMPAPDYLPLPVILGCLAMREGMSYYERFNQNWQKTITHSRLAYMDYDNPTDDDIGNLLNYICLKLEKEVERMEPDTVQAIYAVGFASHNDSD